MNAKTKNAPDAANVGALVQQAITQNTNDSKIRADCTVIYSISQLTKTRTLGSDGYITNKTAANMIEGSAEVVTLNSLEDIANIMDKTTHNQAITWGVHIGEQVKTDILSTALYEERGKPANALTRTKAHFKWPDSNGVLMLDCDDKKILKKDFIKSINDIIPLDNIAHIWRPSSSSYISNKDTGVEINGLAGQRLYIIVKNAHDIPRAGQVLFDRLWLAGQGRYEISVAGRHLERSPIDQSVFQPNRLDFVSGSVCVPPLVQRKTITECHDGVPIDSEVVIKDLTAVEQKELADIKSKAKAQIADEVATIKDQYSHKTAVAHLAKQGIKKPTTDQIEEAKANVMRSLTDNELYADFIIMMADGATVTVGEILDNPDKYHNKETKDPLEPEYNEHKTVGKLYIKGQEPRLYSNAHGGVTFKLKRQSKRIKHDYGDTYRTTQETLALMRLLPTYYDMGDNLVSVRNGAVMPFSEDLLGYNLGGVAQYYQTKTRKVDGVDVPYDISIDPPIKTLKQILAMRKMRELKPLNAVINAPTITENNHIVGKQGYDAKTSLYLDCSEHGITIPDVVSTGEAIAAYEELMKPFGTFDFADDVSRSVALSAVLTAVTRPTQPTAPIFAFDAPKQGSGKTYFCECLGLLALGVPPSMTPSIERNEEEIRKTLFAMALEGRRFVVWDNVMGQFNSATMASYATSERVNGRILGQSQNLEVTHRTMILMTGNNITLVGDMPRRVLTCRLDTGIENPTQAQRDLSVINGQRPDEYIKQHRFKLAAAAITLIRGYLQSKAHKEGGAISNKLSSFEEWDTTCRQPVVWLGQHVEGLTDPKRSIDDNMGNDPEHEMLSDMLSEIYKWRTGRTNVFTAGELWQHIRHEQDYMELTGSTLNEILQDLNLGKTLNSLSIGRLLKYRHGRIANGLKLELVKASSKGNSFRVIRVA